MCAIRGVEGVLKGSERPEAGCLGELCDLKGVWVGPSAWILNLRLLQKKDSSAYIGVMYILISTWGPTFNATSGPLSVCLWLVFAEPSVGCTRKIRSTPSN